MQYQDVWHFCPKHSLLATDLRRAAFCRVYLSTSILVMKCGSNFIIEIAFQVDYSITT